MTFAQPNNKNDYCIVKLQDIVNPVGGTSIITRISRQKTFSVAAIFETRPSKRKEVIRYFLFKSYHPKQGNNCTKTQWVTKYEII